MASANPVSTLRLLLGGAGALAVAMGIGRFGYTALLPSMQAGGGLTLAAAGWLASLNFAGYLIGAIAAAAIPGGPVRSGCFRLGLAVSLATTAAMAADQAMPWWGFLRLLSGVASGVVLVLGSAIVLDQLAARSQSRFAWGHFAGVGTGIAVSTLIVVLTDPGNDWRAGWLTLAMIGAVLSLPCWTSLVDAPAPAVPALAPTPAANRWRLQPVYLILLVSYFFEGAGYIVTGTFLVAILKTSAGLAPLAGSAWIVVGLAAIPSGYAWTRLAHRIGEPGALVSCLGAQAFGIILPLLSTSAVAALLGAVLFGGTFMAVVILTFGFSCRVSGLTRGRTVGLLTVIYSVGQILGPLAAAHLAGGPQGFAPALVAAAVAVAVAAALAALAGGLDRGSGRLASRPN